MELFDVATGVDSPVFVWVFMTLGLLTGLFLVATVRDSRRSRRERVASLTQGRERLRRLQAQSLY